MHINKKKKIGLLILLVLIILALFFIWDVKAPEKKANMTPIIEVEIANRKIKDLAKTEDVYLKVDTFIRERVTERDIFLEFDLEGPEHEHRTVEELREELFKMFYAAIKTRNMDYFTSVISGDSIQDIWDGELNIEKRIDKMEKLLEGISRSGKLETINYQFEKDKYGLIIDKGNLYLDYEDNVYVQIPFEIELIGEDDHRYYRFVNSMLEMEQLILQNIK